MAMDGSGYSLADIKAVTDGNEGAFSGGAGAWWIIILFLFVFMGGGAWGNNARNAYETCATQGQMTDQFNFEAIRQGQADIVSAVKDQNSNVIGVVKDVAYNNLTGIRDIEAAIAQNAYNTSNCCCETNRNIDNVKFDMANYACAIQQNTTENTQKILDLLANNRMADMQNEINQLQLQSAMSNVVRYPTAFAYNAGVSPFCGGYTCGCGCGTSCGC